MNYTQMTYCLQVKRHSHLQLAKSHILSSLLINSMTFIFQQSNIHFLRLFKSIYQGLSQNSDKSKKYISKQLKKKTKKKQAYPLTLNTIKKA